VGADTLGSIGGYQSNHTRQVAALAAKLGLKAVLVQERWVDWPDPLKDQVGNIMLSRIIGAEVRLDPSGFGIGIKDSWNQALEDVRQRGGTPPGRRDRHSRRMGGRPLRDPGALDAGRDPDDRLPRALYGPS
jgi:1-aminocyclopropane-1-carboxylate deaminase